MSLIADARAAIAALDAVETALNARLEGSGTAVPELKRFLERVLTTLERNSAVRHRDEWRSQASPTPATPETPARNGHGASMAMAS